MRWPAAPCGKILATTDGSDLAAEAFPHTARLAGDETEVLLVTVIDSLARAMVSAALRLEEEEQIELLPDGVEDGWEHPSPGQPVGVPGCRRQ